jgi:hypothetical protein
MNINYKLVYELREFEQAIFAARRGANEAEKKVLQARDAYRSACAKAAGVGVEDLEFSDTCCSAKGICSHVYHIKVRGARHGSSSNKCIFCGCDNWSD